MSPRRDSGQLFHFPSIAQINLLGKLNNLVSNFLFLQCIRSTIDDLRNELQQERNAARSGQRRAEVEK